MTEQPDERDRRDPEPDPGAPTPPAADAAGDSAASSEGDAEAAAPSVEAPDSNPVPLGIRLFLIPFIIVAACGLVLLIGRMLSDGPKTASDYIEEIRTSGGNRRWQAAYEFSTFLDRSGTTLEPGVTAQMVRLFEDIEGRDPQVRRYLALCLGKVGDSDAVPSLIRALDDSDPDTRLYAAWGLGALGEPAAVGPLVELEHDEDDGMRTMVAYSLGSLGTPPGMAALERMLRDPARDVRWNAATGLARQGSDVGADVIIEMLDRAELEASALQPAQQEEVMMSGIRALALLDDDRFDAPLRSLEADDPSPAIRKAARDALAAE